MAVATLGCRQAPLRVCGSVLAQVEHMAGHRFYSIQCLLTAILDVPLGQLVACCASDLPVSRLPMLGILPILGILTVSLVKLEMEKRVSVLVHLALSSLYLSSDSCDKTATAWDLKPADRYCSQLWRWKSSIRGQPEWSW